MPTRITREHNTRAWDNWQVMSGILLSIKDELAFPHTYLCKEAALAGIGIALMERRFVEEELAARKLVAPCGWMTMRQGLVAMFGSARADGIPVRAFVAWLKAELSVAR